MMSNSGSLAKRALAGLGSFGLRALGTPMLMYDAMAGTANEAEVVLDKIGYEYMDKMDDKMIEGDDGAMYSINDLLEFYTPEEIQQFI